MSDLLLSSDGYELLEEAHKNYDRASRAVNYDEHNIRAYHKAAFALGAAVKEVLGEHLYIDEVAV